MRTYDYNLEVSEENAIETTLDECIVEEKFSKKTEIEISIDKRIAELENIVSNVKNFKNELKRLQKMKKLL